MTSSAQIRSATNSALIDAVLANDVSSAELQLIEGADPNVRGRSGWSALRLSGDLRHPEMAACLLSYGANHRLADPDGVLPLNPTGDDLEGLHAIRQRYHRYKKRTIKQDLPFQIQSLVDDLDCRGIIKLPQLISAGSLAQIKSDFEYFVQELDAMLARNQGHFKHYDEELHWWTGDNAYLTNNVFKYSAELIRVACNQIVQTVNAYIGKPAHIQRGVGMRYLPSRRTSNDMFGWHHDMEDRRLKAMILLTDLGENDQYMSYMLGTNKIFHPLPMFLKNESSIEYCNEHVGETAMFRTLGRAGDVFIFDSNGTHRGNRSPDAALRDAVFIEYSADKSQVWGGDIDKGVVESIEIDGANPFERMLKVEKKWKLPVTRQYPDWVHTLPNPDKWI